MSISLAVWWRVPMDEIPNTYGSCLARQLYKKFLILSE